MWNKQDLSNTKLVFIPFNPSNVHWILVVLKVAEGELFVLDPMNKTYDDGNDQHKQAIKVGEELFSRKFRQHSVITIPSPDHVLQTDGYNCGIFICYYVKQIVKV